MCDYHESVNDTIASRTYAGTDIGDDGVGIPDQQKVKKDVGDLLSYDGKIHKADDRLKVICQASSFKEEINPPLLS